jgi:hypothetical protein
LRPSGGVFSGGSGWDLTKKFSQWTYAAEAENVVVGYLTGCPDSRGFTKAKLWRFALPLLVDICRGHYFENRDVQQHYNQGIRLYREEKLEPAIAEWPTVYSTIQITKATALSAESNSRSFSNFLT